MSEMGLHNRAPAVCAAMRSKALQQSCGITLTTWDGPRDGTAVNVTYSLNAPGRADTPGVQWSPAIPFESKAIEANVPHQAGLYQLLQEREYPRYKGSTRILKIGMSETNLRNEALNHLRIHTAANRLARLLRSGVVVSVVFVALAQDVAQAEESRMLREFEDRHWDLPLLNSQRGYARGTDAHYRE